MVKLSDLKVLLSAHYILNAACTLLYPIARTFHPFCKWLFPSEECEMDWRDLEVFSFLAVVLAVKNRKLKPATWQEIVSMIFIFSKISNFVLFARQDIRLAILFLVVCLVLFIVFPEPSYKGPDNVKFFRGQALDEELHHNPSVTWIVEFYAPWAPPCVRLAPIFAELSLQYSCEYLKFGKLDVGKYPLIAKKHKIDTSVLSKQVPSIIVYEGGKEVKRRPTVDSKSVVAPYSFTAEKLLHDFNIKELYSKAKEKQHKMKGKDMKDKKQD